MFCRFQKRVGKIQDYGRGEFKWVDMVQKAELYMNCNGFGGYKYISYPGSPKDAKHIWGAGGSSTLDPLQIHMAS